MEVPEKKKKPRGGSRKGRPNKSTAQVKEILDRVVDFDVVAEKLYELVNGVTVQETYRNGETVVYTRAPDASAAKTLLEFRFGKAPQSMKIEGGEKPLFTEVRVEIVKPS